jgi:hypothetical protein
MTQLFNRNRVAFEANTTVKDKPARVYIAKCNRCGGAGGSDAWKWTGYTCYDCGGSGRAGRSTVERLYTVEELDVLDARKAKADAKRQAKADAKAAAERAAADERRAVFMQDHAALIARAERFASRSEFVADVLARMIERCEVTEKQAAAIATTCDKLEAIEAAKVRDLDSQYIGQVGKRIEIAVTVAAVFSYERPCFGAAWHMQTVWIVSMRDDAGNVIVSKSPSFSAEKGEAITIRATVKEHSEYKGVRQTIVQRVAVQEVAAAA